MKMRFQRKTVLILAIVLLLAMSTVATAQITYEKPTITSYQVVNLGQQPANIIASYYNSAGTVVSTSTYTNVPPSGVVTVLQALDTNLPSGQFSAVLGSNQPLAAIVNQQLGQVGSSVSTAPFSSYTAVSSGAKSVIVPVIMYNWFGYHTEMFIQNVGGQNAANVTITYAPTSIGTCVTGATGQSEGVTVNPNASVSVSQKNKTNLGAPSVSGCGAYAGRFLGAATITSNVDIAVVVNQYVQDKLFTYNGFTANDAGTTILAPAYMRNWYNYYASLTIANPGTNDAQVQVIYTPAAGLGVNPNTPTTANHIVPAGKSITIYDGPTGTSDISSKYPYGTNNRFFGSVKITSLNNQPVVAMVNQEATAAAGNQAGSYNGFAAGSGTQKISIPLIQSDFYGYYTSLTIVSVDGTNPTVKITYTSDRQHSAVKNTSKSYTHTLANGFLNRYEGPAASPAQSDILDDPAWKSGGTGRFIGSAVIEVVSGSNIVAFVNSESNSAPQANTRDSMYTYNAFNLP
jgi:hypothetical protein